MGSDAAMDATEGTRPGAGKGSPFRLPRAVTPSRYAIELRLDPAASTFAGAVDIAVTVHEPVAEIVLNASGLVDVVASIVRADGADGTDSRVVNPDRVVHDVESERLTLGFEASLPTGAATLRISFSGRLSDDMEGVYRSRYRDDAGVEHVLIATDFEATRARRCFPCWDEPDLKAAFTMTVVVPEGLTALANTPEIAREAVDPGFVRVRFAESMVMSTYLVCVVVGLLALTPPEEAHGVPVRVAARPERAHLAAYAIEVAVFALDWFGDYFGIAYPEQKLDQAAIPDFAQGAMENTGLITYREALLLLDPATAAYDERRLVAEVICHEVAHMWFGNLVTMRWWNGVWLNEAFATFMAYLCVDAMEPSWRVFEAFQSERIYAFEADSLANTRPIEFPVQSPDDASGMFDVLTYQKGGAVLRMIEQWLDPLRFRAGIRRYLADHAHANTETHDLWDALEAESGQPVRRIMDAWIFQAGFPVVEVRRVGDTIRLAAHRFGPSLPADSTTWPVPLIVRQILRDRELVEHVLVEADGLELPLAEADALVVANAGSVAFVRTLYDDELRARLVARASDLAPAERHALVDDAWAAVVVGDAPMTSFLDLATGLAGETAPAVWQTMITGLAWCDRFLSGPPRERFRTAVRALVRPALERVGRMAREDDTDPERELRGDLIRALGVLGNDPETQADARAVEALARAGVAVEPSIAAAAIDVVACLGGPAEFEAFSARLAVTIDPQEEQRYRNALTEFRDPLLLQRALELATSEATRPQDAPFMLARAMANREAGGMAWRYVRDRWDELVAQYAPSNLIYLAQGALTLTEPDLVADVQAFFAEHEIPQNRLSLVQRLEHQRRLAAMRRRVEPELAERYGG